MQIQGYAYIPLDISDFPTRHNYGLALWQSHIERILADWAWRPGPRDILRWSRKGSAAASAWS